MHRSVIICPDRDLANELEDLAAETGSVAVLRVLDRYPTAIDLSRTLRAHAPGIIFLGLDDLELALATAQAAEATVAGIQIITISSNPDPQALLELMRVGIRECLASPFRAPELRAAVARAGENLARKPLQPFESEYVYSFLPAKPGVGTSTIAMNVAWAAAKIPNTKTLLLDLDLNSGMQRFMMKLESEFSITDAAENAFKLDEELWPQLVSSIGELDILHSGRLNPGYRIEPSQMRHMVEFMRRYYKLVCVDLSGNMEKYSVEIMQESRRILLVTTSEIASLHLAREKLNYLRTQDLADRVSLLVNRDHKRASIDIQQIEQLMGIPASASFPNDYQGVNEALASGKAVESSSDFGKQLAKLSRQLLELDQPPDASKPTKPASLGSLLANLPGMGIFANKKSSVR